MSDIYEIAQSHQWETVDSVQWGERGLGYDAAASSKQCAKCGARFTHFYHRQPNIYKAMADAGITPCTGQPR